MKKNARLQHQYLEKILSTEDESLHKLHQIVADSIKEEALIVENLLHPPKETFSRGQMVADKVATFGGSWTFIISFGVVLFCWIVMNVIMATKAFDPYPFILLNLVFSTQAAYAAPIIMMSQNRSNARDRAQADSDYRVNLKAELEIVTLHEKVDHLLHGQWERLVELQDIQIALLEQLNAGHAPGEASPPAAQGTPPKPG